MIFSIWRKVLVRKVHCCQSCLHGCLYPVQQNASSIWPIHRVFSTNIPNKSIFESSNSEAVKELLRDYGFDDTHISEVARLCSNVFKLSAKKNILPKLKFFNSIGISNVDLPKFVMRWPLLLSSSLENQIIPCYVYLKNVAPSCDRHFIWMLKNRPCILMTGVTKVLAPNIELLRGMGVPTSSLTFLVIRCSSSMSRNHGKFKSCVNQVVTMGMEPLAKKFIIAVHVLCSISEKTWEHKVKLYRSFGLSNDDILLTFRKQPLIMASSEKKIVSVMEFFLNEMKWDPAVVVRCPAILLSSLERKIIPRCCLMEILVNKGLVKKKAPSSFLMIGEEKFLNKYIYSFKDDFPELSDIYFRKSCFSQCKTAGLVH